MPYPASIFLFTDERQNEPFNQAAREILQILHGYPRRFKSREYDLGTNRRANGRFRLPPRFSSIPNVTGSAGSGPPIGEETER
jgi:hypothetical protein